MPRHFGPQNMKNGYAAMGNALGRPRYGMKSLKSIHETIEAEKRAAMRRAQIKKK